jgi:hypothetical protein
MYEFEVRFGKDLATKKWRLVLPSTLNKQNWMQKHFMYFLAGVTYIDGCDDHPTIQCIKQYAV